MLTLVPLLSTYRDRYFLRLWGVMRLLFSSITVLLTVGAIAWAMGGTGKKEYSWRYKMTVEIETPEGIKAGSAVREIRNSSPLVRLPDVGNAAGVRGEAVVVDLGERGVLFALISHHSDNEFYNAFPVPGNRIGNGGSSPDGIKYYASLPIGTKGVLKPEYFPGYPKLVTFTDMDDPKSVTLAQTWTRNDKGLYGLQEDRMEELFGQGVKLKGITLEITDEPVTWGHVKIFLGERHAIGPYVFIRGWAK